MKCVEIGGSKLFLGDSADILPGIGTCDVVITDPPYGIGESVKKNVSRECKAVSRDYGEFDWDKEPISDELMNLVRSKAKWSGIFGGNYYKLPPTSCWLVWDKLNGETDFADCELMWTNWPKAVRIKRHQWHGMIRAGNEERFHPTQKPLAVMKWAINLSPQHGLVLDPFMGSGTTGVAAVQMGLGFIGIERDERYFEIACKRIESALKQPDLFIPAPPEPTQETLI